MKFAYKFSNLVGTVYRQGDVVFSGDGNSVLCPVGNKISVYDLRNNRSHTLPIEARYNYRALALSPNGLILIASIDRGEVQVINLKFRKVLYRKHFNRTIHNIQFSPDGRHFAITKENTVFVYCAPGADRRVFNPFVLERVFHGAHDFTTCLDWSFDSRLLAVGSRDKTTRVCAVTKLTNLKQLLVAGNNDQIVASFFDEKNYDLYTVAKNGCVSHWLCSVDPEALITAQDVYRTKPTKQEDDDEEDDVPDTQEDKEDNKNVKKEDKDENNAVFYKRKVRLSLSQHLKDKQFTVTAAEFHKRSKTLVAACSSGDFLLLDMTDGGALVHSLNISQEQISSVRMNVSGDWVALGVSSLGQLLVWEWQSETYVLKQQGHFNNMRVVQYSPDGQTLATGGEDGKVKLWSTQSSFSFVTFSEHTAPVTGLAFTQSGRAVLSASLDGTVRACDLIRYRNFKTLTSPKPAQFACVCVDTAGELVAAGGQDTNDIYVWSLKLGRLLEVLAGHTGPVVSVQFAPLPGSTMMASTAWDGTVKVWDAIADTSAKENIPLTADGMCVVFRPDGNQIAVATLDGQLHMFDPNTGKQQGNIMGQADLGSGKADEDKVSAKNNQASKCFSTLCYSSDGGCVIAGGQSKNVCIYNVAEELLIKKFEITQNRAFDAMDDYINRKKLAENGVNLALVERRRDVGSGGDVSISLPGARRGDKSKRNLRPEVRVTHLTFSPTGRSWAACTSEGLLVYSLDSDWLFDPLNLDVANTPSAVKHRLKEGEYSTALMMALRLNINVLKQEVIENIPLDSIGLVVDSLSQLYVEELLKHLADAVETSRHLGLYARWCRALVATHGPSLKARAQHITTSLNALTKALSQHHANLTKVCSHNEYMLSYLLAQATLRRKRSIKEEVVEDGEAKVAHLSSEAGSDGEGEVWGDIFSGDEMEA